MWVLVVFSVSCYHTEHEKAICKGADYHVKKIVILNGSPRKNGNTAALTAAFKKGAEEAGNEVTEFFPAHMLSLP